MLVSGGSYNYLYSHAGGLEAQRGDIEAMRDRLQELEKQRVPGAARAARQTRMVLNHLKLAEQHAQTLSEVWRTVEWRDSGDYGDDQVDEALAEFMEGL
jgi:hypothetical protein